MADNVNVGGVNYSTDDVTTLNGGAITAGTAQTQRIKVQYGDDNTARDVSPAFPMPTNLPDVTASGNISAVNGNVVLALTGQSGAAVQITGTWTGTLQFEGTVDGSTWVPINAVAASTSGPQPTTTVNGLYRLTPGGLTQFRVFATALTVGMAVVTMRAASGTGGIFANQNMPVTGSGVAGTPAAGVQTVQGIAGATAVPVSGTFFQGTQPVSLATNNPDVTDRAARLLGVLSTGANTIGAVNIAAAQTVAVTQATAANLNATVVNAAGTAAIGHINELRASTLAVTVTAATATAATLTLPAAGAGLFHYITGIEMTLYSTAARTGSATPIVVTTTNLPGSIAYTFATAAAIGATDTQRPVEATPIRSSVANTATTIVAPIVTGGIWRLTATYFTAV